MLRLDRLGPSGARLRHLNAARRGGTEIGRLPLWLGQATGLPDHLDGLLVASDLQGRVPSTSRDGSDRLLGVAAAEWCADQLVGGSLASPERVGVVLAGDLYSLPGADRRGGHGDVSGVWRAFADRFAWVVGVAGNHDDVGELARACPPNVRLLDGTRAELDGLTVGGAGQIAGDSERPGRREPDEQDLYLEEALRRPSDLLVLHEGPGGDGARQPGSARVEKVLGRHRDLLVVCGHVHWEVPLAERPWGQVLNVDGRAVLLRAATA